MNAARRQLGLMSAKPREGDGGAKGLVLMFLSAQPSSDSHANKVAEKKHHV